MTEAQSTNWIIDIIITCFLQWYVCILLFSQYGLKASLDLLSCTLSRLVPTWKPFMAWMAASALTGLSYDTNPETNKG